MDKKSIDEFFDSLTDEELKEKFDKYERPENMSKYRFKTKKVFISGKITGVPIWECINKFTKAEYDIIRLMKLDMRLDMGGNRDAVFNPLYLAGIHFGIRHDEAMEICFNVLKTCTHIYMLKDWKDSKGAMMEHQFAIDNDIEVIYEGGEE